MISYRTVIAVLFPELVLDSDNNPVYVNGRAKYQNKIKYLPIDYQEDRSVTANSKIISQPLQNGDTMSDHMYRDPVTVTIKGKFALNGRNWNNDSYSFLANTGDRLTSIQWVFEYIKNSGTLCTITTIATDVDSADYTRYETKKGETTLYSNMTPSKTRFLTRDNMALTSISWTEKQNVLDFSFTFTEVIMIDEEEYYVDAEDLDLPSLRTPQANSIGTMMFNTGELHTAVIQTLYDNGYIENGFLRWLSETGEDFGILTVTAVGIAVGLGIVTIATASIAAKLVIAGGIVAKASVAVFPVGTIIAGVAVVACGLYLGIKAIIEKHKQDEKRKIAFTEANAKADTIRLQNLLDDIEMALNNCGANVAIYSLADDDQSICIPIGGNFYYISFTSMSDSPYWKADVRVNSDAEDGDTLNTIRNQWPLVTDFTQLNENVNLWFKDLDKQYEVYLVNPSLSDEANRNANEKAQIAKMLSTYTIWVSKGHIRSYIDKIKDAIDNAIVEHDFEIE